MSGIIRGLGMKREAEFVKLIDGENCGVAEWVASSLQISLDELLEVASLGFVCGGKLIGGVVYGGYRKNRDVWLTIYSNDKKWCSRRILKIIFGFAFDELACRRVNVLVEVDNSASFSLVKRLGFVLEGRLREFSEKGKDTYILGMCRDDCKFVKKKEKKNV